MMTVIETIDGGQKDVPLRKATIKNRLCNDHIKILCGPSSACSPCLRELFCILMGKPTPYEVNIYQPLLQYYTAKSLRLPITKKLENVHVTAGEIHPLLLSFQAKLTLS